MRGKSLFYMTIVAIILCGAAIYISRSIRQGPSKSMGQKVFADMPVNDIDTIKVTSKSGTATITRVGDSWVTADRFNYPANFEKIKNLLIRLGDIKITQSMRVSKKHIDQMKFNDPAGDKATADNSATVVTLSGGGRQIQSFMVGAPHMKKSDQPGMPEGVSYPDGSFISIDQGKTAYLVKDTMEEFGIDPKSWLNTELFTLQTGDIEEMTLHTPSNQSVKLYRKEGTMRVDGIQAIEEVNSAKVNAMEASLGYLRLDDVADPSLKDASTGLDNPYILTATTKDGEKYTAKISSRMATNETRFVKFEFALLDAKKEEPKAEPAVISTNAPAAPAKTDAQKKTEEAAKAEQRKQQEEKIKGLNEQFGKWTFVMERYRTDSMIATRDELVSRKIIKDETGEKSVIRPGEAQYVAPAPDVPTPSNKY